MADFMNDLDAIEALKYLKHDLLANSPYDKAVNRAIDALSSVNRWIPCSERMPAEWQIVAAYGEKIGLKCVEWHPEMGVFIDTQSEYDEQIKPEYFTKWIPLPEEGDSDAG